MLKAFSWVVIANLARQLAFLAVNSLLFSRLSRPYFGALALAFGYMTVFIGLGEFGIRQIAWRDIARYPERAGQLAGKFLSARVVTGLLALAAYLLLEPLLWEPTAPVAIYFAYGMAIVVNQATFEFPLFGLDRIDLFAKFSLISFSLYVILCTAVVTHDELAWLVPVFLAVSMSLLLGLEVHWVRRELGELSLRLRIGELGAILRESWPIGAAETINRMALSYPVILIGILIGSEDVGNYRIAEIGYSFIAQFGYMFASAGFSGLAHTFEHDRAKAPVIAGRMLIRVVLASLAAGTLFTFVGPRALPLLFDGVTPETLAVVRLLGVALVVATPARFFRGLLASVDEQRALMVVNGVALSVGLIVGWFATRAYGIGGMAGSLMVTEATSLLLSLVAFRRGVVLRTAGPSTLQQPPDGT